MAYLQSVVNGTGFIDREYGVGRGRIDLQLRWPYQDAQGRQQWQHEAVEIKVWRDRKPDPLDEGLGQLDEYLDRLGLDHGVLAIFDRRSGRRPGRHAGDACGDGDPVDVEHAPPAVTFAQTRTPDGRAVTLMRA